MTSQSNTSEMVALSEAGQALMLRILDAFPDFEGRWSEHRLHWQNDDPVPYLDINSFVWFVVDEILYRKRAVELRRAFFLLDQLFIEGDEDTRDLIGIGFIEDLQTILSGKADKSDEVIQLLPRTFHKVWNQVEKQWAGRSSLPELIEAETAQSKSASGLREGTWKNS